VLSKCLASEEIFQTLNSEVKQEILEAAAKDITRALGGELNQLGNQEYIINSARFAITVSYVPSISNFFHQMRSLAFSGQKYFAASAFKLVVHSQSRNFKYDRKLNNAVNLFSFFLSVICSHQCLSEREKSNANTGLCDKSDCVQLKHCKLFTRALVELFYLPNDNMLCDIFGIYQTKSGYYCKF
jgi:hypothetical protein